MPEGYRSSTFYILVPFVIVFAVIIFDTGINRFYLYRPTSETVYSNFAVFVLLTLISVSIQYFILLGIRSGLKNAKFTRSLTYKTMLLLTLIGSSAIAIVLGVVIFQILTTSSYNLHLLTLILWMSYSIGLGMLSILVIRFFNWYRSSRNRFILLYATAILAFVLNASATLALSTLLINGQPVVQYETIGTISFGLGSSTITGLDSLSNISSIISFVLMWSATVLFLRAYSRKMGRIKYWSLMSLPLLYFLIQFQPLFLNALYFLEPNIIARLYIQVFAASKVVGGVLFGISFWIIVRKIENQNIIRVYILVSGFGIAILFGSNQGIILSNTPYPPFGLFTVSFFGLASYLTLVGIYYSAISASQDAALRRSIRKLVEKQINLVDVIGNAEVMNTVTKNAMKVYAKHSMEAGFDYETETQLDEEEIKEHVKQAMTELKKQPKR